MPSLSAGSTSGIYEERGENLPKILSLTLDHTSLRFVAVETPPFLSIRNSISSRIVPTTMSKALRTNSTALLAKLSMVGGLSSLQNK